MKIYLAGPQKGLPKHNLAAYVKADGLLQGAGYKVEYATVAYHTERTPCELLCDLEDLEKCDGVALLPGWELSGSANIERLFAEFCGIPAKPLRQWLSVPEDRMTATEIMLREMERSHLPSMSTVRHNGRGIFGPLLEALEVKLVEAKHLNRGTNT